jgi:ABC-type proline/glycine betaine transport system ATPase subunit
MTTPDIEPIKIKEYTVKHSKFPVVGKLPIRSIILGPSGSGKTVLLQNMILNIYRDCFNRIYVFSPSIDVDFLGTSENIHRKRHEGLTYG